MKTKRSHFNRIKIEELERSIKDNIKHMAFTPKTHSTGFNFPNDEENRFKNDVISSQQAATYFDHSNEAVTIYG
jgi:hypothetical protein